MSFNSPQTSDRSPLTVDCARAPDGKLSRKTERLDGNTDEYAYAFDRDGRLLETRLNGKLLETYRYNASGQRILQVCRHGGLRQNERQYRYDSAGRLAQAGRAEFYYDRNGALGQRCDDSGTISFEYGNGSRLDTARRRDSWEIRYEYGPLSPQPIRRFKYGRLIHEYVWLDAARLSVCRDHDENIEYQFFYDANGKLDRLRLVNLLYIDPRASGGLWGNPMPAGSAEDRARLKAARLDHFYESMARNNRKSPRSLFDESYAPREFLCCVDQVGTLRALVAPNGAVIKEIKRDSFGVPYHDSFPNLHLPIGFAGGLEDPDTGLVRFGWRDYDPTIGRFTSLDPAKDRRGDGDLYDYCMDDPVSRVDPTGLWSKENFDESKVSRDGQGQFASTPGGGGGGSGQAFGSANSTGNSASPNGNAGGTGSGSGGNASPDNANVPQSDSGWLVADAGGTATDAGGVAPGEPATAHDNEYFPGTRMRKETMRQTWQQHRDLYEEPELAFAEALVIGFGNIPESGIQFVGDLCNALLSPIETIEGLFDILAGYGCQVFGIESDYRLYSDAVTEYYRKRYGSYAGFKKHLADDPVGLAADLSIVLTAGASAVRGLAKAGATASMVLPAGAAAQNVGKVLEAMEKAAAGMKTAGIKIDPLYLPGKYMGKVVEESGIRKSVPDFIRDRSPKIGTTLSRAKKFIGPGGTLNAIKREQENKK